MKEYCVTGGTGLLASHLIKALLEKGYYVRVTVRDPENVKKVGFLWEMKGAKERLKLFKADLLIDGSFDAAIEGVHGVFHVACPVVPLRDGDDVQKLIIDPSVKGSLNVLNSCIKAVTLKRVVLTSSGFSINQRDDVQEISHCNESHWSDLDYCKRYHMWYAYAKTLGEKMAWQIAEENGLDLVVVHPSFIVGPLLSPQPSSTLKFVLELIKGERGGYLDKYVAFVHVDDVVDAHVLAMEEIKVTGRLICSCATAHWSDIINMLRAKYPMYPYETKPINQKAGQHLYNMDTSKIRQLGISYFKSIPEMFDDCIMSFQEKGLLQTLPSET